MNFGKIRIQIIIALFILGVISVMAIIDGKEEFIAIVTGCVGGVIALGMKLLEGE
jgi:hypothetical protein